MKLYLASGTTCARVVPRPNCSGWSLLRPRDPRPRRRRPTFSKRAVIERILRRTEFPARNCSVSATGWSRTQEVRRVGGTAVAVASDESPGVVNRWKRDRLVAAGADVVIADYREHERILAWLFDKSVIVTRRAGVPRCPSPNSTARGSACSRSPSASTTSRSPTSCRLNRPSFDHPALPVLGRALRAGENVPRRPHPHHGRARHSAPVSATSDRPDGARPDHPHRHERRRADPRLGARADRRDDRERGPLHPAPASSACGTRPAASTTSSATACAAGPGLGEAIGQSDRSTAPFPHKDVSILAAAYRLRRAGDGPRRHRLRHHPRASELRRRGAGPGQLPRLPDLRADRARSWKAACC